MAGRNFLSRFFFGMCVYYTQQNGRYIIRVRFAALTVYYTKSAHGVGGILYSVSSERGGILYKNGTGGKKLKKILKNYLTSINKSVIV